MERTNNRKNEGFEKEWNLGCKTVEHYKVRLVTKEFTQTYDMNYTETFTLVEKLNTIQVLLSLTANLDWTLQQFNIKNAFLSDKLDEKTSWYYLQVFVNNERKT